jgi:asparagine synthase (glutamine-hydrolysing)
VGRDGGAQLMCGIAGLLSLDGSPPDLCAVEAMTDALAHRGPDDRACEVRGPVSFGHRRLSIIDLSSNGRQPMWTDDGTMGLVFNGEIYNFADIRRDLEAAGYRFHSGTDSEVILNAVHRWGIDEAVGRFIGMFAFAIWDARSRRLTLCRDRAGVKPLYYGRAGTSVVFGSELKALLAHPRFRRTLNPRAVTQFFIAGYIAGDVSIFADASRVSPGHYVTIEADGTTRAHRYWNLEAQERGGFRGSFADAAERLDELSRSAFKLRLVSDVPVGVFLSGGIDSSYLAGVLKRDLGADLLHISIGFRESQYDETTKAAAVAARLGVRHMTRYVDASDAQNALGDFTRIYDEPFADTSGIPTALLSRIAREHVKVALSADGGDEQFCGYESYGSYDRRRQRLRDVPWVLRRAAGAVLASLPHEGVLSRIAARRNGAWNPQIVARYEKFLDVLRAPDAAALIRVMNEKAWTAQSVHGIVKDSVAGALAGTALNPEFAPDGAGFIGAMMRADYHGFLADDVLVKVDRASMAASLECRDPLLDHRLAEFAHSLPLEYLFSGGEFKRILKARVRPWAGNEIADAPKRGFVIPLYEWLRGPWRPLVQQYLTRERIDRVGVLNAEAAGREVARFYQYPGMRAERVMAMLLFQMWAERWYLR